MARVGAGWQWEIDGGGVIDHDEADKQGVVIVTYRIQFSLSHPVWGQLPQISEARPM
jgi:hypothetical protein